MSELAKDLALNRELPLPGRVDQISNVLDRIHKIIRQELISAVHMNDDGHAQVTGYVQSAGCFAGIHVHDNSTAQSIATGATYVKCTAFADNEPSSFCTPDATNDKITITETGLYLVNCTLQFSCGTNSVEWWLSPFLNGVEQDNIHIHQKIGTAGDIGSAAMTGIIDVTVADYDLDVRARHDNAGAIDLTIEYGNLNVLYLGAT